MFCQSSFNSNHKQRKSNRSDEDYYTEEELNPTKFSRSQSKRYSLESAMIPSNLNRLTFARDITEIPEEEPKSPVEKPKKNIAKDGENSIKKGKETDRDSDETIKSEKSDSFNPMESFRLKFFKHKRSQSFSQPSLLIRDFANSSIRSDGPRGSLALDRKCPEAPSIQNFSSSQSTESEGQETKKKRRNSIAEAFKRAKRRESIRRLSDTIAFRKFSLSNLQFTRLCFGSQSFVVPPIPFRILEEQKEANKERNTSLGQINKIWLPTGQNILIKGFAKERLVSQELAEDVFNMLMMGKKKREEIKMLPEQKAKEEIEKFVLENVIQKLVEQTVKEAVHEVEEDMTKGDKKNVTKEADIDAIDKKIEQNLADNLGDKVIIIKPYAGRSVKKNAKLKIEQFERRSSEDKYTKKASSSKK